MNEINLSEGEWKKKLSPEQFRVLREKGTEPAGVGKLLHNKSKGICVCAGCGQELFSSKDKFDSKTGWPSFYGLEKSGSVELKKDFSLGIPRTEVLCSGCGGHLGHVFDHPESKDCPTGKRFCINSAALDFEKGK